MNTTLPDAESRVMKLVTDFNEILDAQDMDDFPLSKSPRWLWGSYVQRRDCPPSSRRS